MPCKAAISRVNRLSRFLCAGAVLAICLQEPAFCAAEAAEITNAADVLALPGERALEGIPVHIQGVVTVAEKYWKGRFFIQDESGGVFVDNVSTNQPSVGDLVDLHGVSHPGAFAPTVSKPGWEKIGIAPLPKPKPVPIERLMSGAEDSQRVQIKGVIRAVDQENGLMRVDLVSGGCRLHVYARTPDESRMKSLVGAHVRASGTAAASFNATLRELITVKIFAPLQEDFVIEKPGIEDPFAEPLTPISGFAQYRNDSVPGMLVHVRGEVVHQRPGQDLFLTEKGRGLHVESAKMVQFKPGDIVEAAGFRDFDHFMPVLRDAVFRKVGTAPTSPPRSVPWFEITAGLHHADYITVEGKLLEKTSSTVRRQTNVVQNEILTLQGSNMIFTAELEKTAPGADLADVPVGSVLKISGAALTERGENGRAASLELLVSSPNQIRVLQKPSWLTAEKLMVGLAILLAVSIVGFGWTVTLSKKNSALRTSIHEEEKAKAELQQAHDQLEQRIIERTAQLKFEITARKEADVKAKAILTERTRLAQELHDTLEQSLTGIALQLDTTSKLFQKNPDGANRHLELARNLMSQSQVEVRRSIWDLRCRALEQFDLASALRHTAKLVMEASNIKIEVLAKGNVGRLPESIEDNLLRMAQEALTNVIKHAEATEALAELHFGADEVILTVRDNGKGFDSSEASGPRNGHFGLLGMSERAKRLGANLTVSSTPGTGTTIRIVVPINFDAAAIPPLRESSSVVAIPAANGHHRNGNDHPPSPVEESDAERRPFVPSV
jgi:signal transduction histidine kinase